jgi:putative OPT family oligopeptide transporter
VSGGILSWLALIPLISIFVPEPRLVQDLSNLGFSDGWRASHTHAEWIYRAYVRYIGAGAVACAGVMTLIKTLPTIVSAFKESVKSMRGGTGEAKKIRTEDDLGMGWVIGGSIILALLITILPKFPHGPFPGSLVMGLMVVVFGFFFVPVSSRIVGIIGTSSNPISGMTIATLMATCVVFVLLGRTGDIFQPVALCVGALVCVAAANAGATSQDLKTGYLVGATPRKQQIGCIIGVLVPTLAHRRNAVSPDATYRGPGELHGIGGRSSPPRRRRSWRRSSRTPRRNPPWAPVLVGAFLAIMAQLAGAHALSWAVG